MGSLPGPLKLFNQEVYQSRLFTKQLLELDEKTAWHIVDVTARHYTLFTKLKHKLVLGQLSQDLPDGYRGASLQFLYTMRSGKACFIHLKVGGYTVEELAEIEAAYAL